MPRVQFTQDFDWAPEKFKGRVVIAFKAGSALLVTTPCALAAFAAGKARPEEKGTNEQRR